MTNLDQFESVFNASVKDVFQHKEVVLKKILVVTDLDEAGAAGFSDSVRQLLSGVIDDSVQLVALHAGEWTDVDDLLARVKKEQPNLICGYRNMKSQSYRWPYSLGIYLSVLTRMVDPPVLVLPHPRVEPGYEWTGINTDRVMVVTDHLAGDERLVNWGLRFTEKGGTLLLAHVEDDEVFRRYIDIIGKIPEIDTDIARELIRDRLLREPADYIDSCRRELDEEKIQVKIESLVSMGHRTGHYKRLVEDHNVDLVVFRSRETDSELLAMHGVAYQLALELQKLPVIML